HLLFLHFCRDCVRRDFHAFPTRRSSDLTDTLVLVVSEETGQMSIVRNDIIHHNLSTQELRKKINEYLYEDQRELEEESILDVVPKTKKKKKNKKKKDENDQEQKTKAKSV